MNVKRQSDNGLRLSGERFGPKVWSIEAAAPATAAARTSSD
jgi:hypothetical protein